MIAALPGPIAQVFKEAAVLLETKVQHVRIFSGTLRTQANLQTWMATQQQTLQAKLKDGPMVVL